MAKHVAVGALTIGPRELFVGQPDNCSSVHKDWVPVQIDAQPSASTLPGGQGRLVDEDSDAAERVD